MAEINPPTWLQGGCYTAEDDRALIAAIVCGEGVHDRAAGDLQVTPNTGMQLFVAAGDAFIRGTTIPEQGMYFVRNDAPVGVTIAASDPTDARIDLVIARVYDTQYDASGLTEWRIEVVTGTASPAPVPPALPDSSIVLATVTVGAGVTVINAGAISDDRAQAEVCAQMQTGGVEAQIFTTSGSFDPANYPDAKTFRARVQAAGGSGGGAGVTGGTEASVGSGGAAGNYAESFIPASTLTGPVAVTVPGTTAPGGMGGSGNTGGNASFGSLVIATGGPGGATTTSSTASFVASGINPAGGSVGQLVVQGGGGKTAFGGAGEFKVVGVGGDSHLGAGGQPGNSGVGINGGSAHGWGGGGAGGHNRQSQGTSRQGGSGGPGIVIVEVYY